MKLSFYGAIEKVDVTGSVVSLRCVREFYHADGLMGDDVWTWFISDLEEPTQATLLVNRHVCGFEVTEGSVRVWLDEGDDSVSLSGSRVWKKEEARGPADLERVIALLSKRVLHQETEYLVLSRKMNAISVSVRQRIDRLQRRAEFEKQRRNQASSDFAREIEDLNGILRRIEDV